MSNCQICGREPAKHVKFRAHQGVLIFRREIDISGTFCRDHALEAYYAARGVTLKGMWFSPGSLVFGALRSIVDAVKLLDLPDEVKDRPWEIHFVACPKCHHKNVGVAGPIDCAKCGNKFVLVSCSQCKSIDTAQKKDQIFDVKIDCRICHSRWEGFKCIRNWPDLLLFRWAVEAIALFSMNTVGGSATLFELQVDKLWHQHGIGLELSGYLNEYYKECAACSNWEVLQTIKTSRDLKERLSLLNALGKFLLDGQVLQDEVVDILIKAAKELEIEEHIFIQQFNYAGCTSSDTNKWWEILGIQKDATETEVAAAYKTLARVWHPDKWSQAAENEKIEADRMMKAINSAFEQAARRVFSQQKNRAKQTSRQASGTSNTNNEIQCDSALGYSGDEKVELASSAINQTAKSNQRGTDKTTGSSPSYDNPIPITAVAVAIACIMIGMMALYAASLPEREVSSSIPSFSTAPEIASRQENSVGRDPGSAAENAMAGLPRDLIPNNTIKDETSPSPEPSSPSVPPVRHLPSERTKAGSNGHSDSDRAEEPPPQPTTIQGHIVTIETQDTNDVTELISIGIKLCNTHDHYSAIEYFSRALVIAPNSVRALHNRGVAFVWLKDYRSAWRDFESVRRIDPIYALKYAVQYRSTYQKVFGNDLDSGLLIDNTLDNRYRPIRTNRFGPAVDPDAALKSSETYYRNRKEKQ